MYSSCTIRNLPGNRQKLVTGLSSWGGHMLVLIVLMYYEYSSYTRYDTYDV